MTSRPRSGPNSHRQRSREYNYEFPPLVSTLRQFSNLTTLNSPHDPESAAYTLPPPSRPRPGTWSTVARRAERIRTLDERALPRTVNDFMEQARHHSPRRLNHMRNSDEARPPANLDELDRSLDEANSHLQALLDLTTHTHLSPLMPLSSTPPPPPPPPVRSHDFLDDNRRSKRRKLDADRLGTGVKAFRYGKYGQVEAGLLRMEIFSCDGGIFSNEESYAAENILKNDGSVYCTKGNRCNVVLSHQGETPFSLSELVIKAPARTNYSHPVREGMVFIVMDQDELLRRTAQYQIQYATTHRTRGSWIAGRAARIVSAEAGAGAGERGSGGGGDDSYGGHIISIRHHDDGSTSTTRARRSYNYVSREADDDEGRVPQMPPEFSVNLPEFKITTECSDEEEDDEVYGGGRVYRGAPNIGSLPFENPDPDSDELPDPFGSEDPVDDLLHHSRRPNFQRSRMERESDRERERMLERERELAETSMSLEEALDAHANARQEAVRAVGGGELLTPHARFYIERRKSKCTIKFDPPVSGRFILLKMWSSQHDPGSNIDIQSVMARGFAGPRFFPAVKLR